ncbi:hypothetical protein AAC387_Pa04g1124 [Persea americana]
MSALVNIQCRKVKPPNSYDDIFGDMFFLDGPPAEQYGSEPRDRRLTDGAASAFGDRSSEKERELGSLQRRRDRHIWVLAEIAEDLVFILAKRWCRYHRGRLA